MQHHELDLNAKYLLLCSSRRDEREGARRRRKKCTRQSCADTEFREVQCAGIDEGALHAARIQLRSSSSVDAVFQANEHYSTYNPWASSSSTLRRRQRQPIWDIRPGTPFELADVLPLAPVYDGVRCTTTTTTRSLPSLSVVMRTPNSKFCALSNSARRLVVSSSLMSR